MQAMLIGGRAFFGRDLKTNFQRTGTYHILSGVGDQRGYSRLRLLLGAALVAHGRGRSHHSDHPVFVGLRVSCRPRAADRTRDDYPN